MTTITNNKLTDEKIKIRINAIEERHSASRDFWDGDYEYPEDIELLALLELQELRRNYLALRGEIEDVRSQLYEAENQANEYASELQERRKADSAEPDYIRYDCGCCGWQTINDWRDNDVCPKCNHKPMGKTELYTAPPVPDNKQTDELVMWVKRLSHSLRNARPDSKLHGAAMDYLSRKGVISVEDVLR